MSDPFTLYRLLHHLGLFCTLTGLAGVLFYVANGGTRQTNRTRRLSAMLHGVGLLLMLLGGFGMLARQGMHANIPGWAWGKVVIWLLLGAAIVLPYRNAKLARPLAVVLPLLALLAAAFALLKPF